LAKKKKRAKVKKKGKSSKAKKKSKKKIQKKAKNKPLKKSSKGSKPTGSKAKAKSPFSKQDIDTFKNKLLELRRKVTQDMSQLEKGALMNTRDASGELSGHTFHMADVASDVYDQELNIGLASSEQSLLNRIEGALKRIEEGTYGLSVTTGKPISKKRLVAVPYAELTVQEQEEEEKKRKLAG